MQDGDRLVGMGCATSLYPTNTAASAARVRIAPGVTVHVQTATHETGTGVTVVLALMASEALGVPLERITVELGDSTLPPSPVAGGSNNTASLCAVVARACEDIRSRIAGAAVTAEDRPFRGADPASPQLAGDAGSARTAPESRLPRAQPPRA